MSDEIGQARHEAADSAKCYLLDLPGELRNRIYHYVKEDEPVTYCPRRLEEWSDEDLEKHDTQISTRLSSLALAQTCHQLLQEYAPIYAANTNVHVCYIDLAEYLDAHLPYLTRTADGTIAGNIYTDHKPRREVSDMPINQAIHITPLLALCKENPDLRVRGGKFECFGDGCDCGTHWSEIKPDLHHLFEFARDPDLGDALVEAVSCITLDRWYEFSIGFKKGKIKAWVTEGHVDPSGNTRQIWTKTGYELSIRTWAYTRVPEDGTGFWGTVSKRETGQGVQEE